MADVKDAQERAIRATLREERARDAARALHEHKVEQQATLDKTARLRALRLAQQVEVKKPRAKAKKG
jgi:hypothetical protein